MMKSIAIFILSILLLQSGVPIYSFSTSTLRSILECSDCSEYDIRRFSYRIIDTYTLNCPNLNDTFESGVYSIPYCKNDDNPGRLERLICTENKAQANTVTNFQQTLHCSDFKRSIRLITTSSQCDYSCNRGICNATSSIADTTPDENEEGNEDIKICRFESVRQQASGHGTCTGCCSYDSRFSICSCQQLCNTNVSTNVTTPTPSISHRSSDIPMGSIATRIPVATSRISPTSTGVTNSQTTTTTTTTNSHNNSSIDEQNIMLILVTAFPGAIIGIIVVMMVIVFLMLTAVYLKRRRKALEHSVEEGRNYETLNGYKNTIVNPNFEPPQVHSNGEPIATQEPMYAVISENRLSNGFVNSISLQMETDTQQQIITQQQELARNSGQYGLIINELYAGLVEGAVIDRRIYGELRCNTIGNPLFSPNDSLEINPVYHFCQEDESLNPFVEPPKSPSEIESNLHYLQIRKEELELGERIASGHFGLVYRATYHTHKGDIPVAVKSLKQEANSDMTLAFMREAATLAQFNHPNVLRLIGVLSPQHQQPCMIVTELLRTELREFLLKLKHPNSGSSSSTRSSPQPQGVVLQALLLKFSQEIAAGMAYLAEKKFIHRDLAARNVLVAKDLTIRVADFGMSREMDSPENNYYTSSGGKVPLRWTAPEALLYMKYSEKSDVWAFGMTLYEIWSLGDKPWGSASNEEIIETLSNGCILSAPFGCPEDLYQVMMQTWTMEKTGRPTFNELKTILSNVNLSFYHKLSEIQ